jgi:hypothetical protein
MTVNYHKIPHAHMLTSLAHARNNNTKHNQRQLRAERFPGIFDHLSHFQAVRQQDKNSYLNPLRV